MKLFDGIKDSVRKVQVDRWYSLGELKEKGLHSEYFENSENGVLTRINNGQFEVLGISVASHFDRRLRLGINPTISSHDLAAVLGSPDVYERIEQNRVLIADRADGEHSSSYGLRGVQVNGVDLRKFKSFISNHGRGFEERDLEMLALLPNFDIGVQLLAYLATHHHQDTSTLAKKTKKDPVLIEAALYKLGYRPIERRQDLEKVGQGLFQLLHDKSRPWKEKERNLLEKEYFFRARSLPSILSRTAQDVEYHARLWGLEKFETNKDYTIRDAIRIAGFAYEDFQQALFRGDLHFTLHKGIGASANPPDGSVLIEGKSLIRLAEAKEIGIKAPWVFTRADGWLKASKKSNANSEDRTDFLSFLEEAAKRKDPVVNSYDYLLSYARSVPVPTVKEETLLGKQKNYDLVARNDLIEGNLKAAFWIGMRYFKRLRPDLQVLITLPDIVHEAARGLIRGVHRYDPSYTYQKPNGETTRIKIITNALNWMEQHIDVMKKQFGDFIRIPIHLHELKGKVLSFLNEWSTEQGIEPTAEEISKYTGVRLGNVRWLLTSRSRRVASLDKWVDEKQEQTFGGLIANPREVDPARDVSFTEQVVQLRDALYALNARERNIIMWRHGMGIDENLTLEEISIKLKVSRERIRQLEAKSIIKLRKKLDGS